MKRRYCVLLAAALVVMLGFFGFSAGEAQAGTVIKLGTSAPKGSPWHDALMRMAEEWKTATNGAVELKVYPGGTIGNEVDMVRKMRQGRLDAATITSIGIREIDAGLLGLQVPRLVQSNAELDYAMEAMRPQVEKRLADQGFVLLQPGDTGWVRLFTTKEARTLDEMRTRKLFVGAAETKSKEAWSRAGFLTVEVSAVDVLPSLQTGLLDGAAAVPLAALSMQWFGLAKYMLDFKIAPLVGGTVITQKAWSQIPAEYHAKLLEIVRRYVGEDLKRIRSLDDEAIETMKKNGLIVVKPTPEEEKRLHQSFVDQWPYIRQEIIPTDIFDTIRSTMESLRVGK